MSRDSEVIFGLLAGLLTGLLLTMILLWLTKADRCAREYDERQVAARGKGYKYGFFTFMFCNAAYGVLSVRYSRLPLSAVAAMGLIVVLSVMVHACYCIWHDAYFALNENRPCVMAVLAVAGLGNLVLAVRAAVAGEMTENGIMGLPGLNLFCAAMLFVIAAELLVKHIMCGSREGEDA